MFSEKQRVRQHLVQRCRSFIDVVLMILNFIPRHKKLKDSLELYMLRYVFAVNLLVILMRVDPLQPSSLPGLFEGCGPIEENPLPSLLVPSSLRAVEYLVQNSSSSYIKRPLHVFEIPPNRFKLHQSFLKYK